MSFSSNGEIKKLLKEINRFLSQEMSNICLKVSLEKNWRTQNFNFISLKSSCRGQFWGSSKSGRYHWIFILLVAA